MRSFLVDMNQQMSKETRTQTFDKSTQNVLKKMNIPLKLNGNSRSWWGTPGKDLSDYAMRSVENLVKTWKYPINPHQKKICVHSLIGYYVRIHFELRRDDNFSAHLLTKIPNCPNVILYQSATMVDLGKERSLYRNLVKKGNLKHVANIYAGPFPLGDVYEEEKKIIEQNGGIFQDERAERPSRKWRYLIQKPQDYEKQKRHAMTIVAGVIKSILLPKGKLLEGNILVHCGGGMHRTGMIIGIIRKAFSDATMEEIIDNYRFHVGYKDEQFTGGAEPLNIKFIQEFDTSLIQNLTQIRKVTISDGRFCERGY